MRKYCSHVVVENFFEPCVLFLLSQKKSYGYELMQELSSKCTCRVNVANLYRGLARLEKSTMVIKKKVKGERGPSKIVYEITNQGKNLLSEWILELEEQNRAISKLINNYKKINDTGNKQ